MLRSLGEELKAARDVRLDVSDAAIDALLANGGFDAELGARPMRRAIGRLVETPIAEMILKGELIPGDVALVDVTDGRPRRRRQATCNDDRRDALERDYVGQRAPPSSPFGTARGAPRPSQ